MPDGYDKVWRSLHISRGLQNFSVPDTSINEEIDHTTASMIIYNGYNFIYMKLYKIVLVITETYFLILVVN